MAKGFIRLLELDLMPSDWVLDVFISDNYDIVNSFTQKRYDTKLKNLGDYLGCAALVQSGEDSKLKGEKRLVVYLEDWDINVMAHELIHILWKYSEVTGSEMNKESEEWQAIMYTYMFKECCKMDNYKSIKVKY